METFMKNEKWETKTITNTSVSQNLKQEMTREYVQ